MRIGICGTHGTGKTTLANYLVKHLNKEQYIYYKYPEYARDILDSIKQFDPGFNWRDVIKSNPMIYSMFEATITLLYEDQSLTDNYIADRIPLDILAYLQYYYHTVVFQYGNFDILRRLYYYTWNKCSLLLQSTEYDILIFLRAKEGDELRLFIDKYIYDNLNFAQYKFIRIYDEKPSLEKVLEDVKEDIENLCRKEE